MLANIAFKIFLILFNLGSTLSILQDDPMEKLQHRAAIIFLAIIIAYISRFILIRFMNRWMMSKSSKVDKTEFTESIIQEVVTKQKLSFELLNSDADLSAIVSHREVLVERAKKMMKLQYTTNLIIILAYIIAGVIHFNFDLYAPFAFPYFLFVLLLLIWTSMRQIGYKHQFTAYKDGLFDIVAPIWKFVFAVFQSKWCSFIAIAVFSLASFNGLLTLSVGEVLSAALLILAACFHGYMIYRLNMKARKQPNLTLLILRVFLIKRTSLFTFSQLAKFWKYFGSYFTVADPSFYKVYWKRNFKHTFPVVIIAIFLVYTQVENSGAAPFEGFIALMFFGAFLFIIFGIRNMKRNFVSSEDSLQKELSRLKQKPVKWDGTFKETPVSCYDNTWQMTVNTLVETSSVVLMDLRGFSEKNKGCEFEVNLLLNKIALKQILFIGYSDTIDLVKSTITREFETLDPASPNKNSNNHVATIFEVKAESKKEVQYIMDVLIHKAMG